MKLSWVLAIVVLYLIIMGAELMLDGGSSFNNVVTSNQSTMIDPEFASSANAFTQAWTVFVNLGTYLKVLVGVLFLWSPTLFTGYYIWFWWYVCFPLDLMMVFGLFTIARGVHAS